MVEWKNINQTIDSTELEDRNMRNILLEGVEIKKRPNEIEGRLLVSLYDKETEILKYQGVHFMKYNYTHKEWTYRNLGDLSENGKYARDILKYVMDMKLLTEYNNIRNGL